MLPKSHAFRINYTGRAALWTFFHVKPATSLGGTIHDGEENGKEKSTESDETQNTDAMDADDDLDGQTGVTNSQTTRPAPTSTKIPTPSLGACFTTAFRGRTMRDVTVIIVRPLELGQAIPLSFFLR